MSSGSRKRVINRIGGYICWRLRRCTHNYGDRSRVRIPSRVRDRVGKAILAAVAFIRRVGKAAILIGDKAAVFRLGIVDNAQRIAFRIAVVGQHAQDRRFAVGRFKSVIDGIGGQIGLGLGFRWGRRLRLIDQQLQVVVGYRGVWIDQLFCRCQSQGADLRLVEAKPTQTDKGAAFVLKATCSCRINRFQNIAAVFKSGNHRGDGSVLHRRGVDTLASFGKNFRSQQQLIVGRQHQGRLYIGGNLHRRAGAGDQGFTLVNSVSLT